MTAKEEAPQKDQSSNQNATNCNLFVAGLPSNTSDSKLREIFSPFGEIVSAKVMVDFATQQLRDYGFVRFAQPASAAGAISGLAGKRVPNSTAALHVAYATHNDAKQSAECDTIYVRNLPTEVGSVEIQEVFSHYGTILDISIPRFQGGSHQGVCFVRYQTLEEARAAVQKAHNTVAFDGYQNALQVRFRETREMSKSRRDRRAGHRGGTDGMEDSQESSAFSSPAYTRSASPVTDRGSLAHSPCASPMPQSPPHMHMHMHPHHHHHHHHHHFHHMGALPHHVFIGHHQQHHAPAPPSPPYGLFPHPGLPANHSFGSVPALPPSAISSQLPPPQSGSTTVATVIPVAHHHHHHHHHQYAQTPPSNSSPVSTSPVPFQQAVNNIPVTTSGGAPAHQQILPVQQPIGPGTIGPPQQPPPPSSQQQTRGDSNAPQSIQSGDLFFKDVFDEAWLRGILAHHNPTMFMSNGPKMYVVRLANPQQHAPTAQALNGCVQGDGSALTVAILKM